MAYLRMDNVLYLKVSGCLPTSFPNRRAAPIQNEPNAAFMPDGEFGISDRSHGMK
jgi:hypothetical protein